jgi:hypothetical protein
MSTWFGSMTSVMTGSPVRSRASARKRRPWMPRPWNAYGLVRGLNAPPRRIVAPAAATASAVSSSCSRLSTEHGPAIIVSDPSPIAASRTRMTVSSGWNSRDVSLNGRLIGVTDATPGRLAKRSSRAGLREPISPTRAMTRGPSPRWSNGVSPSARIWLFTPRISASVAPAFITTNIACVSPACVPPRKQKSRGQASAPFTRHDPCPAVSATGNRHAGHRK